MCTTERSFLEDFLKDNTMQSVFREMGDAWCVVGDIDKGKETVKNFDISLNFPQLTTSETSGSLPSQKLFVPHSYYRLFSVGRPASLWGG